MTVKRKKRLGIMMCNPGRITEESRDTSDSYFANILFRFIRLSK